MLGLMQAEPESRRFGHVDGALWAGLYLGLTTAHLAPLAWLMLVPRGPRERLGRMLALQPFARYSNWFAGLRPEIVGAEHLPMADKGNLYVANHESALDIPLLLGAVARPFVMKDSLRPTPFGWGATYAGSVSVHRDSAESRERACEQAIETARRYASMIVFSEGTFGHRDGRLRAPQLGLLMRAHETGLGIVPLGHAGTRRALDGDRPPFRRGVRVALVARPPLRARDHADPESFARAAWTEVVAAVREARALVGPGAPYEADPGADWDAGG